MNKALEDLQAGRDPFAPPKEDNDSKFFQNIAKWSSRLPLVAGIFCFVVLKTMKEFTDGGQSAQYVRLVTLGICGLLF